MAKRAVSRRATPRRPARKKADPVMEIDAVGETDGGKAESLAAAFDRIVVADDESPLTVDEIYASPSQAVDAYGYPVYTAADEETVEVWCGTITGAPKQNIALCGVSFPHTTDIRIDDPNAIVEKRNSRVGATYRLTHDKIAAIKEAAARKAFRVSSKNRYIELDRGRPSYRPNVNDVPFGKFVYLVPVADMSAMSRDSVPITTLIP